MYKPEHKQVRFFAASGKKCTVDEGMFETLTVLKKLGVITQYSCEGGKHAAYLLATGKSARKLEKRVNALYRAGLLSFESAKFFTMFMVGARELEFNIFVGKYDNRIFNLFSQKGNKNGFTREYTFSPTYGYRIIYRWPVEETSQFLATLIEIDQLLNKN